MTDEKLTQKPIPGRIYLHYKGGLYEVLHLAKYTNDDSDLVICKSIHYGTYHARPLSEWFDVVDNNGHSDITRFEMYNG